MRTALQLLTDLIGGLSAWLGGQQQHLSALNGVNADLRDLVNRLSTCSAPAGTPEHAALVADLHATLDASETALQAAVRELDAVRERALDTAALTMGLAQRVRGQAARGPGSAVPKGLPPLPDVAPTVHGMGKEVQPVGTPPSGAGESCQLPLGRREPANNWKGLR